MKVNVMYVCSTLKRSGPTNQLFNIIKNLSPEYFVTVCTLSPESDDSLKDRFINHGVNVLSLNLSRVQGVFFCSYKIKKIINNIRPNVIHSQGVRADKLVAALKTSAGKVSTLRNYPQYDYPMTYGKAIGYFMTRNHIKSLKCMDRVVGVSNGVCNNLAEVFNINNSLTILNGVDTSKFYPLSIEQKSSLKKDLGLPEGKKLWISVGHLNSRKNPLKIISSFKKYNRDSKAALLFVGGGGLMEDCISNADENIIFLGRVSNVQKYLNASDYFVSASKAEGFPNTVLESLACGIPVLLSDIGPHREFFEINDKIGRLFPQHENFDKDMQKMTATNYDDLSLAAANLIDEHLSASIMSRKYQDTYKELVDLCQK